MTGARNGGEAGPTSDDVLMRGGNMWAPMSADEELGYVYVPTTSPTNDMYDGHRRDHPAEFVALSLPD